jgi:hypothetical protein
MSLYRHYYSIEETIDYIFVQCERNGRNADTPKYCFLM